MNINDIYIASVFAAFFTLAPLVIAAQENATLTGKIVDAQSGQTLAGANIYTGDSQYGTSSKANGTYTLTLEPGEYIIKSSFLGYETFEKEITLQPGERKKLNIDLQVKTLQEVEVTDSRNQNTESTQMGKVDLKMSTLEKLPAFMGEVDLVKSLQLLPGVATAGEGDNGLYVRGGGPDQNLILLDGATVYNANHLFGFFSVFNSSAIEDIELIKGGMPANYGGRMASVLDISQRDGNYKEIKGSGGIGLISSRLSVEGPIKKDTASFMFTARRTYIDVLMQPFIGEESTIGGTRYYFYDLNGKLSWKVSDRDKLTLSGYYGNDVFIFDTETSEFKTDISWGNFLLSANWNHLFSDQLSMNLNVFATRYRFGFDGSQDEFELSLNSRILDYTGKLDFNYSPNPNHNIKFGAELTRHDFSPRTVDAQQGDTDFNTGEDEIFLGNEYAVYALDKFDVTDKLRINAGLRVSAFQQFGPFTRYNEDVFGNRTDTTRYSNGEVIAEYAGLEPRLSMRYKTGPNSSIKAGYNRNYQYVQLATLSPISLPTDIWLSSTSKIEPQNAWQASVGYFADLFDDTYEASVEVYYKDLRNLIEYEPNTQPEDGTSNNEDNLLITGKGRAYGIEFFLNKRFGKLTGWIGYTLAKNERQFDDLNDGNWYPATYDRRHDISLVLSYDYSDRWTFGANFVYATGKAVTLPVSRYFIENRLVSNYADRNSFRMKPYHRLDLSATLHGRDNKEVTDPLTGEVVKRKKKITSDWTFAIFNVYSRLNPYFYYFEPEGSVSANSFGLTAKQVSLFPILPSVTWNFKF